jgi:5,10-methylenetetrahydromethanopterin reductase
MTALDANQSTGSALRWGVGMWQTYAPGPFAEVVRLCDQLGYDQFWLGNHKLYRDMMMLLTLAASHSERIKLGTFIAEPYTMHPALIAAAMGTLDEISNGRALLGIGTGGANFKELGVERLHPLAAMDETIRIIRGLFAGETVSLKGKVFTAENAKLQFNTRPNIPIVLATRGTRMLELAGRMADEVMIATFARPDGVQYALDLVRRGAEQAGRSLNDVGLISRVDMCVWPDRKVARDAVKPMIAALLMGSYPDRSFVHQMGLTVPEELEEILRERNEARSFGAWRLVPDEFVDAFAWAGTPDDVARQVAEIIKLGITQITFLAHPPAGVAMEVLMRAWMEEVVPRVRRLVGE